MSESISIQLRTVVETGGVSGALDALIRFVSESPLTARVAALEHNLDGRAGADVQSIGDDAGLNKELLEDLFEVRSELGRINDIIHATAIVLVLPRILEPGETLRRPSLAAGVDPTRPHDVETDRRVAEFKLSQWRGADAARKRQTFKDLVQLACDSSERLAELYVLGDRPIRFLRGSTSSAAWALDRFPPVMQEFESRFGSAADTSIAEFTAGPGARVRIVDLVEIAPDLFPKDE